jgi:CRP/FNR family transcriptional regulator
MRRNSNGHFLTKARGTPSMSDTYRKCQNCLVRDRALCSAVGSESFCALERIVQRIRVPEGQVISGGFQRNVAYSIIVAGVVKLVVIGPDGREQIVGLQFPADFVGRPYSEEHTIQAVAATDLEVCSFAGAPFEALLPAHPDIERALLKNALRDLDAARDWMCLLGRKTAEQKVASLLAMIAERMTPVIPPAKASKTRPMLRLPLSRTELADCLNLRLETISRQLAHLKARGIVETKGRRDFAVRDMTALKQYTDQLSDSS